jgi:signal transduction histidine kinase
MLGAAVPAAKPLRSVREIRALSPAEVRGHPPVILRGVITYSEATWFLTFFSDETGGIYLGTTADRQFHPGDRVEVTGVVAEGLTSEIVTSEKGMAPEIRVLSHGELPEAPAAVAERLTDGSYDADWISIRGHVRSIKRVNDRVRLDLDLGASSFEALICGFPDTRDLPSYLLGVPVTVSGVLGTFGDQHSGVTRTVLYVPAVEQCRPEAAFLERKFGEAPRSYHTLFTKASLPDRVHVQGQVTLARPERGFFMRVREDGYYSGSLWVQTTQPLLLRPGQVVDVAGHVESTNRKPVLRDALVRVLRQEPPPSPQALGPHEIASGDFHGTLVSTEGVLLSAQPGLEEDTLILLVGQMTVCARLDVRPGAPPRVTFPAGSRLRVSGVCVVPAQQTPGLSVLPLAYQIWMRQPEDVTLLALPPWWTVRRVVIVLALTACVAGAAFIWIFALRRRVAAQTETIREHIEQQTLQEERMRIAREFHDTFEQHLVGLGLMLETAQAEIADPQRAGELLREAAEMTRHTRAEARHAIWELRTGALASVDVVSLIHDELSSSAQAARLHLRVEVEGNRRPLPAVVQNHLLRIVQESFTNALKHARAECVTVHLGFGAEEICLRVVDNGAGFDPDAVTPHEGGGFGLAGMRERALRMKGNFAIASAPGRGTEVQVRIPAVFLPS